jgi:hypothetical protein
VSKRDDLFAAVYAEPDSDDHSVQSLSRRIQRIELHGRSGGFEVFQRAAMLLGIEVVELPERRRHGYLDIHAMSDA